jgi:hypothetical protein
MTPRDRIHRWHSPTLFTLIALCFLLPFATVFVSGCGTRVASTTTFTGAQLVMHTVPRGGSDPSCSRDISVCVEQTSSTTADVVFGAAIIGLLLGVLGFVRGPGWCAAVGLCAFATLFLQLMGSSGLSEDDVSLHGGFWLILVLFTWAGVVHLRRALKRAREHPPPPEPTTG